VIEPKITAASSTARQASTRKIKKGLHLLQLLVPISEKHKKLLQGIIVMGCQGIGCPEKRDSCSQRRTLVSRMWLLTSTFIKPFLNYLVHTKTCTAGQTAHIGQQKVTGIQLC
jgi:hypothetical protein